jgi:phenylalanyl-tRNA synthetase beta chain
MDLSRKWLNEFVDDISVADIADRPFCEAMTMSGSKVETFRDMGEEIQNVVVGKLLTMKKHPNSDHMFITTVDVGGAEPVQICTGAWNIHVGDLMPIALDGAMLPGGKVIKCGKLRGEISDGMMCSLKELGLDAHNFPYGVIKPAAILNDYQPTDPENPSIPADAQPGHKIYGKVVVAAVKALTCTAYGTYALTLDIGKEPVEIVTDCQNVHEGDLVAYNTGLGVLCTLSDLYAQQKEFPHCIDDGIFILNEPDAVVGADIRPVIGMDDHVIEYEITPNRSDCLSMIGLAREAAVTFGKELKLHKPVAKGGHGSMDGLVAVEVEDPKLCPRYTARMVKNVKIAPSPKWMRERITAMGMRPINNLVDITNYVMMEYGQPMHAFDFSCVKGGKIFVRTARENEVLQTLDGNDRKLSTSMLCICDEDKPIGVAGVMGGANSEIEGDTAQVLFESANFDGTSIRRTAAALNMRTAASARYEKGLDPMMTMDAVNRACELVELLNCGEVVDGVIDIMNADPVPQTVPFHPDHINYILGTQISAEEQQQILEKLGFTVKDGIVTVPSWRRDIARTYSDNDMAEEVARIYGFTKIPATLMDTAATTIGGYTEKQKAERTVGAACRANGYDEALTYSFVSPSNYDKIRLPADSPLRDAIRILNPLGEDTSAMRTTMLPSILGALARNWNLHNKSVRLYEVGRTYHKTDAPKPCKGPYSSGMALERNELVLGAYGDHMDFYDLKGVVESICAELKIENIRFLAEKENPSYHPGRCAKVYAGETYLGIFGQVHPLVAVNYDVAEEMYAGQLNFDALYDCSKPLATYQALPKFPAVERDIAVVCRNAVTVGELEDCIRRGAKGLLKNVSLFDIYQGHGIAEGMKSVAFNLTLRADDRSITSEEADEDIRSILDQLKSDLGAVLR